MKPIKWEVLERDFKKIFSGFPWQYDFAIDTYLQLGERQEVWFLFRDRPLRWINPTKEELPVLSVPVKSRNDLSYEYELGMQFLSRLSYHARVAIVRKDSVAGKLRLKPWVSLSVRAGGNIYPEDVRFRWNDESNENADLAFALFRDGKSGQSLPNQFLSFYKIIELAIGGKKKDCKLWINEAAPTIGISPWPFKVVTSEFNGDVSAYLEETLRNAIAHVRHNPVVNPDRWFDRVRMLDALRIVGPLARKAMDERILSSIKV